MTAYARFSGFGREVAAGGYELAWTGDYLQVQHECPFCGSPCDCDDDEIPPLECSHDCGDDDYCDDSDED